MFGQHLVAGDQLLGPDCDLKALEELCKTTSGESQRATARRAINTPVVVKPGNATQRNQFARSGRLRDLSDTGCGVICEQPLMVGDIFLLEIKNEDLGLSEVFARCIRCRMVAEQKFEHGFKFFNNTRTNNTAKPTGKPLL